MRRGDFRGKEREHKIPSVVGWIVGFSLKRAALNPGCATCQLCPAVPRGHTKLANGLAGALRGGGAHGTQGWMSPELLNELKWQ